MQAAQQQRRDTVSASWGYSASGASPGSHHAAGAGTSLLTGAMAGWQRPERSPASASALGSSPGARFPAGTSPSNSRSATLYSGTAWQNRAYIAKRGAQMVCLLRC